VFQAQALVERVVGRDVVWPTNSRLWSALAEGRQPQQAPLIATLRRGPRRRPALLERVAPTARRLYAGWEGRHLRFRASCPSHGTVSTRFADPLILRHAALHSEPVTHVHISYWFGAVQSDHKDDRVKISAALMEGLMARVNETFRRQGIKINAVAETYLRNYFAEAISLVDVHRSRLFRGDRILPKALWTGTAGNIWDRILRQATREQGGLVTGHDHAMGVGHFWYPWNYFLEFVAIDRFVTNHEAKASAADQQTDLNLLFQKTPPDVVVVSHVEKAQRSTRATTSIRHVMYVPSLYEGEGLHLGPFPPDITMLDWQARLVARLVEWGFSVIHKPHPEGATRPPGRLAQFGHYKRRDEPFEKTWDMADLLLFDCAASTTFHVALQTTKPIVLIDFGLLKWLPKATSDLRERCAVVDAAFSNENRLSVDWREVRKALARAPALVNSSAFRRNFLEA